MGHLVFNIDVMLAKRKMSVTELANRVGITLANMSILKTGKAKAPSSCPEEARPCSAGAWAYTVLTVSGMS